MANAFAEYRKLTRLGKGSYYVLIPPEVVRALGWRERQKLVVRQKGDGVEVVDWKPGKKGAVPRKGGNNGG